MASISAKRVDITNIHPKRDLVTNIFMQNLVRAIGKRVNTCCRILAYIGLMNH